MRITSTNQVENQKIKAIIYGVSGVGKTTLAKTLRQKTLIISSEAGLLSIAGSGIDVIDITLDDNGKPLPKEKRIERLGEAYKYLLTKEAQEKYEVIFIDSLTELSQNLIENLQTEFPDRKDSLVMYNENAKKMRSLIKLFRDIPYYHVFFTALSEVDKDENNRRFTTIRMIGKIAQELPAFFDEVFYMNFIENQESKETKRMLITQWSSDIVCKDRSGKLNKYEEANLGNIINKILGETK